MISHELKKLIDRQWSGDGHPAIRFLIFEDKSAQVDRLDQVIDVESYEPVDGAADYMIGKYAFTVGDQSGQSFFSVRGVRSDNDPSGPVDLEGATLVAIWMDEDRSLTAFAFEGCSVGDYEMQFFRSTWTSWWIKIKFAHDKHLS